ncbi:MAG: YjjG family noncanonical pyrimidine nucleotidase [Anaerolineales bacterium]
MKYTWLLFDADDTLFDFLRAEATALRQTLEQSNLPFRPEFFAIYSRCNQQVWQEFERGEVTSLELRVKRFRLFFHEVGMTSDPQTVSALYLQNLALGTDLLPGAQEVIGTLRGRFHLALVTNGLKDVQRPRLERSVLRDSFERVFISEEVGAAKPSYDYFEAVFRGIGSPPKENVLLIGNSLTSDMRGGLEYGIDTCWYNPSNKTTDLPVTYQIARLTELLALLG